VETGVQGIYQPLKIRDSGFPRNDGEPHFQTFYEIIKSNPPKSPFEKGGFKSGNLFKDKF
jgi:hypothetical protein